MEQGWQRIKEQLQASMPRGQYDLWVATLDFLGVEGDSLVMGCRNHLHIEWLREKLEKRLAELARNHFHQVRQIVYRIQPEISLEAREEPELVTDLYRQVSFADLQPKPSHHLNRRFTFDQFVVAVATNSRMPLPLPWPPVSSSTTPASTFFRKRAREKPSLPCRGQPSVQ